MAPFESRSFGQPTGKYMALFAPFFKLLASSSTSEVAIWCYVDGNIGDNRAQAVVKSFLCLQIAGRISHRKG